MLTRLRQKSLWEKRPREIKQVTRNAIGEHLRPSVHGAKGRPSWRHLPTWLIVTLLRAYKLFVSPVLGPHCRFQPTCSQYTRTAVERYGVVHGIRLGVGRIFRCHPWHPGGYDPVPDDRSGESSSKGELVRVDATH